LKWSFKEIAIIEPPQFVGVPQPLFGRPRPPVFPIFPIRRLERRLGDHEFVTGQASLSGRFCHWFHPAQLYHIGWRLLNVKLGAALPDGAAGG
jgi:hypothetical protein